MFLIKKVKKKKVAFSLKRLYFFVFHNYTCIDTFSTLNFIPFFCNQINLIDKVIAIVSALYI